MWYDSGSALSIGRRLPPASCRCNRETAVPDRFQLVSDFELRGVIMPIKADYPALIEAAGRIDVDPPPLPAAATGVAGRRVPPQHVQADRVGDAVCDDDIGRTETDFDPVRARCTVDEWCRKKTGAAVRHYARPGESTSDMATAARAFGREGFLAYKIFASASALVDTYRSATAAYAAMAGIPYASISIRRSKL